MKVSKNTYPTPGAAKKEGRAGNFENRDKFF